MRRATLAAAATVLAAGVLAGCGDLNSSDLTSDTDEYCAAIEDAKAQFDDIEQFDFNQFGELRTTISDIADKAPERVQGEWATLDDSFGQLVDALDELGIDPADLSNPTALQTLDPAALERLQQVGTQLDSGEFQRATEEIEQQVREDCGINLDG